MTENVDDFRDELVQANPMLRQIQIALVVSGIATPEQAARFGVSIAQQVLNEREKSGKGRGWWK